MIGQNDNINLEVLDKKQVVLSSFGLFYVILLGIIVALGWFYLNNVEYFTREKVTPLAKLRDTAKAEGDLPVVKGTISAPVDIVKESVSTPEKIAKGKTLFETNCSGCHGMEGKGDGVAGKTLNPPPRNFHELTGWTNGPVFSKMYKTLHEGIIAKGMASYNNFTPEDRIALIHYIRTFANFPAIEQGELKELDKTYSLSSGFKQPSQIPIKSATEKLEIERTNNISKVKDIVAKIELNKSDKGVEILRKISTNLNRTVSALSAYGKWNENENAFVKFVTTSPNSKGFKTGFINLSSEEWSILFQYLKTLF